MRALSAFLPLVLFASSSVPQQAPPKRAPGEASVVSPEVMADHRVVFRVRAPGATEVTVAGDFWLQQNRTEKLTKDEHGVWSLTTEPLPSDFYSYFFTVDGVKLPDPANGQIKPGIVDTQSTFLVPGAASEIVGAANVPHGEVRTLYYQAGSLGKIRRMHLYLPPGYEEGHARYPVLYLFHGGGDDDSAWTTIGRVNFVMDNLIAQGKAKPMVIVMPSLWALDTPLAPAQSEENARLFEKTMMSDVIPYVEAHYRVLAGRDHRAVGGLGIGRSFLPNFVWPELGQFGTVLFVSGGTDAEHFAELQKRYPGTLENAGNVRRVKFLMGDGVNDSSFASAKYTSDTLKQMGYDVQFQQSENTHGWPGFRHVFEWAATMAFR